MRNLISAVLVNYLFVFGLTGCAESSSSQEPNNITPQTKNSNTHFQNHFQDANEFWSLIEKGSTYRGQKNYAKALEFFKKALNDHAAMRPEQAVASDHVAMTYEEMGNFEEAAKYYDLASEVTMNENRRASLSQKAKVLYQKSRGEKARS